MSFSNESPISAVDLIRTGREYWLPPTGFGNGLDALFWVCIADVPRKRVPSILAALREADIPGWAAPLPSQLAVPHTLTRQRGPEPVLYRVWVATIMLNAAEDVLMRVLSEEVPP